MTLPKVVTSVGALVVAGLILLFVLQRCEAYREGEADIEARRQDSIATARHAQAIAERDAAVAERDHEREARAQEAQYRAETARQIANLTRAYDRISRSVSGGVLAPDRPTDTAETIGARTLALIDSQRVVIARQDTTIQRDSARIDRLFTTIAHLEGAFAQLDTAYQARTEEAEIYKRQRYGWKDRVTVGAGYGAMPCDRSVCTGWNANLSVTLVRPLRAIDSVTDLVRKIF